MRRSWIRKGLCGAWIAFTLCASAAESSNSGSAQPEMSYLQAAVLGIVEGLTEYIPVSSTGHLLVAQRAMGLPDGESSNAYAIAIQAGAILAVLGLYRRRIRSLLLGLMGRDRGGLHVGICLLVAFLPSAVLALLARNWIERVLFGAWPVVLAWMLGGVAILAMTRRGMTGSRENACDRLESMTIRQALLIGFAQCAAIWPGVSRSLATILGGLTAKLALSAAVEFSFLLGLLTLSAATGFELLHSGRSMLASYGWAQPLAGLVLAYIFAVISVKWMLTYLQGHTLRFFGWYRIALGAATAALLGLRWI